MNEYTIGQAAKAAGVNIETLKYYERRGLVPEPPRSSGNYRLYPHESVRIVRFVKRAQDLGFILNEIGELLSLRAGGDSATCGDVRAKAGRKLRDIEGKIRSLRTMEEALAQLVSQCSGEGPVTLCPILEALEPESDG